MGLYEVTAEGELPIAVQVGDDWQLHTTPGAVVEVADEAAGQLGASLRRLDGEQQAAAQPSAPDPAPDPAADPAAEQTTEGEQPRSSRRRAPADSGGGDA